MEPGVAGEATPLCRPGAVLHHDDFDAALDRWSAELEAGGTVTTRDGRLEIDTPAGCTVWFRPRLTGPVMIEYEATVIDAGGRNDRLSDLNCFWMASDARCPDDPFARPRSGAFADYDLLRGYYVGLGGNGNTTTRFRRYIGVAGDRPLRPEHDLRSPAHLLQPNRPNRIRLVACGNEISYSRNDVPTFRVHDPDPYGSGWFGFRTTHSRQEVRRFRVHRAEMG